MEIKFVKESLPDLEYWRQSGNKRTLNKITQLLKAIESDYKKGLGQPEQLKNNLSDCWSRRINKKDRIVYTVSEEDGVIYIMSLRGHYGDK
jgi:toxin YoeB